MKNLFSVLHQALSGGHSAVLVTVVASSGSTPRGAGARMLVAADGRLAGTIGGGAVEHRCIQLAQELLMQAAFRQTCIALELNEHASLGMVCGGRVDVHFVRISHQDPSALELCRDAAAHFASGAPFWLLTPLNEEKSLALWPQPQAGALSLSRQLAGSLAKTGGPRLLREEGWFCEQLQGAGAVYIFGGGHVAQALVPVLATLNFPCVVLEDRQEFAKAALFPLARQVRLIDFSRVEEALSISESDYVCIMTRGHQHDLLILQQVLRTPARYIGLIGSARKAATAFAALSDMGFSRQTLSRIVTPIGLPIGAETPEEIAISIAAQLIRHRAAGQG